MANSKTELTNLGKHLESERIQDLLYENTEIDANTAEFLFALAQILIKKYEDDLKKGEFDSSIYIDYAYSIIARTCFKINDFIALYDFAVNYGYYPIAKKINSLDLIKSKSIEVLLTDIGMDEFNVNNIIYTREQFQNIFNVIKSDKKKIGFIAPTSYGKSELIFKHLRKNNDCNIVAIIVPTKSLIDQVFREAKRVVKDRKFVIHDQGFYFKNNNRILAIITQERATRLQNEGVKFDLLYIDEAHELLKFDFGKKFNNRALVLTRLIRIARQQNPKLIEIYLTPTLDKTENLNILNVNQENTYNIQEFKIKKDLKILDIRFFDSNTNCWIYDKFINKFFFSQRDISINKYVAENSKEKNLHYLYKPKFIETYAEKLYTWLGESDGVEENVPDEILQLIGDIKKTVHDDYKLAKFLEAGIIYLHGKLPNLIRNYLMKFVRESKYITHFVANSIILAGMNLPIDNLFYISGDSKMNDMNNLIGRVNRLNEIFSDQNEDLKKIFIPIHFLEIPEYPQLSKGNLKAKIKKLRSKSSDLIRNPLLSNYKDEDNKDLADKIVKLENEIVSTYDDPTDEAKLLRAGAQQILNFTESGIEKLIFRMEKWDEGPHLDNFLFIIKSIFFDDFIEGDDFDPEDNVKRLMDIETIEYYDAFIENKRMFLFSQRVDNLVNNWLVANEKMIYIGSQFGEVSKTNNNYKNSKKFYVNLNDHLNDKEFLNNLAVIKLQSDSEFVEYEIMLLLNTLKEFNIIKQEDLDLYFYGTNDEKELKLLKRGISHLVFKKIKDEDLLDEILFDKNNNLAASDKMKEFIDKQEGIEKFELEGFFVG
jgi:hypothetical protein